MTPKTRARAATVLFAFVGLWSVLFNNVPWEFTVPHGLFYAVLTLNTYFSILFHSQFTPDSRFQTFIDLALVASYIALALSIGVPVAFSFCAVLIFAIAPAKYAHAIGHTPYDKTLRRKVLIDHLGTVGSVIVLGLTLAGLQLKAAWILAILFTLANIYLLIIRPMYTHVE